jgi:hypothetical protein
MNSGRSKALSNPMPGFAFTAATGSLQTDVAYGTENQTVVPLYLNFRSWPGAAGCGSSTRARTFDPRFMGAATGHLTRLFKGVVAS